MPKNMESTRNLKNKSTQDAGILRQAQNVSLNRMFNDGIKDMKAEQQRLIKIKNLEQKNIRVQLRKTPNSKATAADKLRNLKPQ